MNQNRRTLRQRRIASVREFLPLLAATLLACGGASARADWPEFRGPSGDGHASAPGDTKPVGLPLHWSETNNVKWKTEIPFHGQSTPVVLGGQVWVTTATEEGHDHYAICLDADSGKVVFNQSLFHTETPEPLGNGVGWNCYATPTPLLEPGRIYVHYGSAGTACLDTATGKTIWQRDDLRCRHYRGPSSSVVSFEDLVILTFDGADLQYVVALDKKTGKTVWKTDRSVAWNDENSNDRMAREGDQRKAHSTPLLVTVGGKPLLLSGGARAAYGYEPRTGREIWKVLYPDFSGAPRPLFDHGLAYFVTGLTKTELLAVKTDGEGDITSTGVAWRLKTHIGKYSSPVLVDGLIYTAADESFLTCVDAATGQVVWSERVGGHFAASPVYADGRLYFFDRDGLATVIQPGRELKVLARNKLDAGFMASPAVSGKSLYLRTKTSLYRVESSTPE
jgi:outer membrane protein assembly factor BamB